MINLIIKLILLGSLKLKGLSVPMDSNGNTSGNLFYFPN